MIQIEGLHYGYGRAALYADFSAQIGQPGIYGVFGRNGSGKSTVFDVFSFLSECFQFGLHPCN